MLNPFIIEAALKQAFIEDNHYMDLTTELLVGDDVMASGELLAKADGVLAGVAVVNQGFYLCDPNATLRWLCADGDVIHKGQVLMTIEGNAKALLKAERIILNFLQRMSGIATMTRSYVDALNQPNVKLADTRKTTPSFRPFEKYSVFLGGGFNHRYNLSDAIMIKDNHIEVCGGIRAAIEKAKAYVGHTVKIEVEVESISQLHEAIASGADIIMLDNMSTEMIIEAVGIRNQSVSENRVLLEVSGNVTLERLKELGTTGVDVISCGALTHSYQSLDISFNLNLK